jgi:hypothetical protein
MSGRDPRSPEGMLRHSEGKIAELPTAREIEKKVWGSTRWIKSEVDAGKVDATFEEVSDRLVRAALATGLVDDARARKAAFRGWNPQPEGQQQASPAPTPPAPVQPTPLRSAPVNGPTPPDHRGALLALLKDPLVRNALASVVYDAVSAALLAGSKGSTG